VNKKREEWLASLEVGDEVMIVKGDTHKFGEVRRKTSCALDVQCRGGLVLMFLNGHVGRSRLEPIPPEAQDDLKRSRLASILEGMSYREWNALPLETLDRILEIVWTTRR
jgi:hypothetical protein